MPLFQNYSACFSNKYIYPKNTSMAVPNSDRRGNIEGCGKRRGAIRADLERLSTGADRRWS